MLCSTDRGGGFLKRGISAPTDLDGNLCTVRLLSKNGPRSLTVLQRGRRKLGWVEGALLELLDFAMQLHARATRGFLMKRQGRLRQIRKFRFGTTQQKRADPVPTGPALRPSIQEPYIVCRDVLPHWF